MSLGKVNAWGWGHHIPTAFSTPDRWMPAFLATAKSKVKSAMLLLVIHGNSFWGFLTGQAHAPLVNCQLHGKKKLPVAWSHGHAT